MGFGCQPGLGISPLASAVVSPTGTFHCAHTTLWLTNHTGCYLQALETKAGQHANEPESKAEDELFAKVEEAFKHLTGGEDKPLTKAIWSQSDTRRHAKRVSY